MGVQPDHWITKMAQAEQMIAPFVDHQVRGGISYGLSSYGYDFRISDAWQVPRAGVEAPLLDPKGVDAAEFVPTTAAYYDLPAGRFVMGRTIEYFRIPRDILTICTGKSTYARCGVTVYVTPFEPEWEGYATIAIVNSAGRPVRIYANEGIAQLMFLQAMSPCAISYADKRGKYQAQQTITLAKEG
jgi:dCTP deaminase